MGYESGAQDAGLEEKILIEAGIKE